MRRRDFLKQVGVSAAGFALLHHRPACGQDPTVKPNYIFLLSDDQNWDGLSIQMDPSLKESRHPYIETPHIAKLAQQGMRFTQAYAPSPVCSPTRASIQTGKSPAQLHWTKAAPSVDPEQGYKLITPRSQRDLARSDKTIGELLQSAGYATAHYGKWHLGGGGPEAHGYDESDGDTSNRDAAPFKSPNPVDIFGMGKRAAAFMEKARRSSKPFYIQLSYHALHYPENALPETIDKYRKKIPHGKDKEVLRAAIAEDLDTGVGKLMADVDRLGLAGRTYVIYMSDNGGGGGGKRRILRGGKGSVLEGGIRVPFIARGPGIAPGSVSAVPIAGYDLLPTLCKLAGVEGPLPETIEGGDIGHLFTGDSTPVKRRFPGLAFHFPHYQGGPPQSSLRMGDYKVIRYYEDDSLKLYNIAEDPGERRDLSTTLPEKAARLADQLDRYLAEVNAELPQANPDHDPDMTIPKHKKREKQDKDRRKRQRRR